MQWSIDGQSPIFLAATRMMTLQPETVSTVLSKLHLAPGMRVLDVGCGSGEYTFRLAEQTEGISYIGLDFDVDFIDFANKRARGEFDYPFEAPNASNTYEFIAGDGLNLPFENATFDAVVSHTYLTALPDWASALAEMCRVCKPGGIVSSITAMTDDFFGTGTIGLFSALNQPEDAKLLAKTDSAIKQVRPHMDMTSGIAPRKVPVSFDWIGLHDVSCKALGHYFCLSDAGISRGDYERYVFLLAEMQKQEALRFKDAISGSEQYSNDDWNAYLALIDRRKDELIEQAGSNHEWNWYGASSLLVCGTVPDSSMNVAMEQFREAQGLVRKYKECADACGITYSLSTKQLNIGRCVRANLQDDEGLVLSAAGFDPQQAYEELLAALLLTRGTLSEAAELQTVLSAVANFNNIETSSREKFENCDFDSLPSWYAYAFPQVWETVAEAAQSGYSTAFANATNIYGMTAVACKIENGTECAIEIAVHEDPQTATYRAFARALGALMK